MVLNDGGCAHGWVGTVAGCPRCQMEAPTDWAANICFGIILLANLLFLVAVIAILVSY